MDFLNSSPNMAAFVSLQVLQQLSILLVWHGGSLCEANNIRSSISARWVQRNLFHHCVHNSIHRIRRAAPPKQMSLFSTLQYRIDISPTVMYVWLVFHFLATTIYCQISIDLPSLTSCSHQRHQNLLSFFLCASMSNFAERVLQAERSNF